MTEASLRDVLLAFAIGPNRPSEAREPGAAERAGQTVRGWEEKDVHEVARIFASGRQITRQSLEDEEACFERVFTILAGTMPDPTTQALVPLVQQESPRRWVVIAVLGDLKNDASVQALIGLTNSFEGLTVREQLEVVSALGTSGNADASRRLDELARLPGLDVDVSYEIEHARKQS
ncbi:MAG: hypothetical protein HOW73_46425 [Polyangiaceae bacterium]|nr:hypothetical protein [Polyangiaceae bacterium]